MKTYVILALLGLAPFFAPSSFAKGPCAADAQKYCSGLKAGYAWADCLERNLNNLSDSCRKQVKKSEKQSGDWKKACGEDAQNFCSGLKFGYGLGRCMEGRKGELSNACRAKISSTEKDLGLA